MSFRKIPLILSLLILFLSCLLSAQNKRSYSIEAMYETKSVSSPVISPDGKSMLFIRTGMITSQNKYLNSIYLKNLFDGSKPVHIAGAAQYISSPAFIDNGSTVAFISDMNGNGWQVYTAAVKGSWLPQVYTQHPMSIQKYVFGKSGRLYFLAEDTLTAKEKQSLNDKWDSYYYTTNKKNSSIWVLDKKNKIKQRLTSGYAIKNFILSPDESTIYFLASNTPNQQDEYTTEIYSFRFSDGSIKRLTTNSIQERMLSIDASNSVLYFVSAANEDLQPYYQESVFRLDIKADTITDLFPRYKYQIQKYVLSEKDNAIYFIANKGVTQQLCSCDLSTGIITELTKYNGVVRDFCLSPTGSQRIVLQLTNPEMPDDFFLFENLNRISRRITFSNPQLANYNLAKYQILSWRSNDDYFVEGILILPPNYDNKRSYPLIVQLHGGPNSSYQLSFGNYWATYPQLLAAKNYLVLQINYRGSTGYGDAFMRGVVGDFFKLGSEDVLSGVDFLIGANIADESKIGIMGYSAGAHFTNWLITQTDRFKFAISDAGLAEWISFYSQTDVPYLREIWMEGTPFEDMTKWIELSPVTHAKNIKTPTLFSCGENDRRVPMEQSQEMWSALNRLGVPTKLLLFPREGHSIEEIHHQITKINQELGWIDTYMK